MGKPSLWANKTPEEKNIFIAKLVDAMVYSDVATRLLEKAITKFECKGYIKSVILPEPLDGQPIPGEPPIYRMMDGEEGVQIIGNE